MASAFAQELARIGLQGFQPRLPGAFYGPADKLAPGAGVIYSGLTYAHCNEETGRFEARNGSVLVLTHECDIDPANDRDFNEHFVFVPLILIEGLASTYEGLNRKDAARSLVAEVAKDKVNRLLYLPPSTAMQVPVLEYGAVVFWNWLGNTHVSQLRTTAVKAVCALSQYGMEMADRRFQEHFLRPKSDQLARLT